MIRRRALVPVLALMSTLVASAAGTLQTPEQFLGFKVGADNKLVRWDKIVDYMKLAAANSDRVRFRELGKTSDNNPVHRARNQRARDAEEPRPLQAAGAQAVLPGRRAVRRRARRDLPPGQAGAADHLQHPRDRDRRVADVGRTGAPPRDQRRARGEEDPRQRHLRARAEPEPRRPDHGHRLVQQERRHASTQQPDPVPLSPVRRPRQQPRHVHVHAEGEPAHRAACSGTTGSPRSGSTSTRWAATPRASS